MAHNRECFHKILSTLVEPERCYFSPPPDIDMEYPCIRYISPNDLEVFADNKHYLTRSLYVVTVIDENPDSKIPEKLNDLFVHCSLNRRFAYDGLYHFVYNIYY